MSGGTAVKADQGGTIAVIVGDPVDSFVEDPGMFALDAFVKARTSAPDTQVMTRSTEEVPFWHAVCGLGQNTKISIGRTPLNTGNL